MIRFLEGSRETIRFKDSSSFVLYNNDEAENYLNHWHIPIEIIMPIVNNYRVVCNHVTFDLNEGDILFIAPGTLHSIIAPSDGKRIIILTELTSLNNIRGLESFITSMKPALLITSENAPLIHQEIVDLLIEISKEYSANMPMIDVSIYAKLFQIFVLINRHHTNNLKIFFDVKVNKQEEYIEKYNSICDYINKNFADDLTLDNMSHMAGFSKYHFERLFKQFTGMSFYKYLSLSRISNAEKLLIDPESTITEIAYKSGFNSISSFIRMFRIVKKCTPTEFRNMYRS